jgi:hypothetical protein
MFVSYYLSFIFAPALRYRHLMYNGEVAQSVRAQDS